MFKILLWWKYKNLFLRFSQSTKGSIPNLLHIFGFQINEIKYSEELLFQLFCPYFWHNVRNEFTYSLTTLVESLIFFCCWMKYSLFFFPNAIHFSPETNLMILCPSNDFFHSSISKGGPYRRAAVVKYEIMHICMCYLCIIFILGI